LVPPPVQIIQASRVTAGQFIMTLSGQIGHTHEIQATQNLKTWIVIDILTLGAGGSLNFIDTNAPDFPERSYRTRDMQP
jgi:hypothetical protein